MPLITSAGSSLTCIILEVCHQSMLVWTTASNMTAHCSKAGCSWSFRKLSRQTEWTQRMQRCSQRRSENIHSDPFNICSLAYRSLLVWYWVVCRKGSKDIGLGRWAGLTVSCTTVLVSLWGWWLSLRFWGVLKLQKHQREPSLKQVVLSLFRSCMERILFSAVLIQKFDWKFWRKKVAIPLYIERK